MKLQVQTIEENLKHYENMTPEEKQYIQNVRQCCAVSYRQRFNIKYLKSEAHIVPQFETVSSHLYLFKKRKKEKKKRKKKLPLIQKESWF